MKRPREEYGIDGQPRVPPETGTPGKSTRTQSFPAASKHSISPVGVAAAAPTSAGPSDGGADDPYGLHLLPDAPPGGRAPPIAAPNSSDESSVGAERQIRELLEQGKSGGPALQKRRMVSLHRLLASIPSIERELLDRRLRNPADGLGRLMVSELTTAQRRDVLGALRGAPAPSTAHESLEMQQFAATLGPGRFASDRAVLRMHPEWTESQSVQVFVRPGLPPPEEGVSVHWRLVDPSKAVRQSGTQRWAADEPTCEPWTLDIAAPGTWEARIEVVHDGQIIGLAHVPVTARLAEGASSDLAGAIAASDTRVAAGAMSDTQLAAQTAAVQEQLGAYKLGHRGREDEREVHALRSALRELTWEGGRRKVDGKSVVGPDDPGELTAQDARSDGTERPQDRALIQRRIDAMIALRGFAGTEARIKDLEAELGVDEASIHGGATSKSIAIPWLHEELATRRKEADAFLERFEHVGRSVAFGLLGESEMRVRAELERYQLERGQPGGGYAGQGLKAGADAGELRDAIQYGKRIQAAHAAWLAAERARPRDGSGDEKADEARKVFETTRALAITKHPMLRPFIEGDTQQAHFMPSGVVPGALDIGKYSPEHFAKFMGWELNQKLVDIGETRSNLGNGRLSVFGVPKLVELTTHEMRVAPGTMLDGAIHERAAQSGSSRGWTQGLIAAISIGLGLLLAVPTGGTSMEAGIAVAGEVTLLASDLYLMGKQFEELGIYRAAANTDLTPIASLLEQEPSAGPLIFAFLGFAGPVAGVGSVVRSGKDLTRALARARESVAAIRKLREAARAARGDMTDVEFLRWSDEIRAQAREVGLPDHEADSIIRTVTRNPASAPAGAGIKGVDAAVSAVPPPAWALSEQGRRINDALLGAGASPGSIAQLTEQQLRLIEAGDQLIAQGAHQRAIATFDELGRTGITPTVRTRLEMELTTRHGKTDLATYRDPSALLPDGTAVGPTAYGGALFHGTSQVAPAEAFENGLAARGRDLSLQSHAEARGDSAFRGATETILNHDRDEGAALWAGDGGWVYKIDGTPSWDVNQLLEGRVRMPDGSFKGNLMSGEGERAFLAGVPPERIVGAYPISGDGRRLSVGQFLPNPNYLPRGGTR